MSLLSLGAAQDERERRAIESRRARDEARRQRFLADPKVRQMGVDAGALQQQVSEKEARIAAEKREEEAYAQYMALVAHQANAIDAQVRRERKVLDAELAQTWKTQTVDSRREFDLYDPQAKQRDLPARVSDDDVRCGPSSLQKFAGEDLVQKERLRVQREQLSRWCSTLASQRQEALEKEKADNAAYDAYVAEMARTSSQIEHAVFSEKRRVAAEVAADNRRLAMLKKERESQERAENEAAAEDEIARVLADPYLNEEMGTTTSAASPNRFRPDHFKHLRPDQYAEIEEMRKRQIAEKEEKARIEKEQERQYGEYMNQVNRSALICEREVARQKAQAAKETREEQMRQAEEKRSRYDRLFNETYVNRVDESFFSQFGSTAR
eukprot:ANDGO_02697.mRNA.1 hypothetical protein NAEGRDRAFT_83064